MTRRSGDLLVGVFVLAMLSALIAGIALLTGRGGPADRYFTVYNNVTDVRFGTPVLYEGYPVGRVEAVTPRPAGLEDPRRQRGGGGVAARALAGIDRHQGGAERPRARAGRYPRRHSGGEPVRGHGGPCFASVCGGSHPPGPAARNPGRTPSRRSRHRRDGWP